MRSRRGAVAGVMVVSPARSARTNYAAALEMLAGLPELFLGA
ncbi:hypothetical protein ABT115_15785 [Streptomyces sp. NPDC001832]